jgi:hypothetical protein
MQVGSCARGCSCSDTPSPLAQCLIRAAFHLVLWDGQKEDAGGHAAPNTSADGSLHALCGEEAHMLRFHTEGVKAALADLRACFEDEVVHVRNERLRLRRCAGAAAGVTPGPSAGVGAPVCCDAAGHDWRAPGENSRTDSKCSRFVDVL